MNQTDQKILLLVSQSPRRQQLLQQAGVRFSVVSNLELKELPRPELGIDDQIKDLALQKAKQAVEAMDETDLADKIILTADTMVVFNGKALGKPKNEEDAIAMLMLLSNHLHSVKTGYCLVDVDRDEWLVDIETTMVRFRKLTRDEVYDYVKSGEPMDKAGAYGIQGEAKKFVSHIKGSYSNVVGLPIEIIQKKIEHKSWNVAND